MNKWLNNLFARAILRVLARYEGATYSPDRPWIPGGYQSVKYDSTAYSRSEMARRMRAFERDDPFVQALAGKFENFVVGANPQLTPCSSDKEWNKRAKEWWDEWCQVCDLNSRQHFGTILQLLARRWFVEGDCFIILTRGADAKGSRPRIQIVEGHLCRTPEEHREDPNVHDGVRMDSRGRPVLYYFAKEEKQGEYTFGEPFAAEDVIPVFEPERPGEVRGMTHFHGCIKELEELRLLNILEMQAAAKNASTSDWIETNGEGVTPDGLRHGRYNQGATTNTDAATYESKVAHYREVSGATTKVLQVGDKIHQHTGERPSVVTRDFWELKQKRVCGCVEIPFCLVYPDSMQGTVYRGAMSMAAAAFKSRHRIIAEVQRQTWGYTMGWARYVEPTLRDAPGDWRKVSIQAPRDPNVDVGRNSAAMLAELASGATNFDLIYGPLGLDWREEMRKLDEQLLFAKEECKELYKMLNAGSLPMTPAANNPQQAKVIEARLQQIEQRMEDALDA